MGLLDNIGGNFRRLGRGNGSNAESVVDTIQRFNDETYLPVSDPLKKLREQGGPVTAEKILAINTLNEELAQNLVDVQQWGKLYLEALGQMADLAEEQARIKQESEAPLIRISTAAGRITGLRDNIKASTPGAFNAAMKLQADSGSKKLKSAAKG